MLFSKPLSPELPADAADPQARASSLAKAREDHVWDWSWPPGCATLLELPSGDDYSLAYIGHVTRLSLEMTENHTKLALAAARSGQGGELGSLLPSSSHDLVKRFFAVAEDFHASAPRERPEQRGDYAAYYATSPVPPLVARLRRDPGAADALFGWQRVAGANPMALRRITRLPEDLPLGEAEWRAAGGAGPLDAALAEGRVYAVDYSFLHGAPATRYLGRQKYLCGARGLFDAPGGALLPVAIQLEPGGAVVTPASSAWAAARYCLQVADVNAHETMEHLGSTHMVMEAVGVAARRQLADEHPLRLLLEPHLEATFAINRSAKANLIAPGGVIDRVFAARIDVAAGLVRAALDSFVLQDRAPDREIEARGVGDPSLIYPYRDDVRRVYGAIERFVESYVRLYYAGDAAVSADPELGAWVAEVASPIGGALPKIRPVETVAGLVEWMANILHIASAQHAAVNFPQYPFFSWGENTAGALWGPPPRGEGTEQALLALMPPWDCLILQADTVYQLSGVRDNRLGDYPPFVDPRVAGVIGEFQRDLGEIEAATAAADEGRLLTYPFLRPSLIPASIHILR